MLVAGQHPGDPAEIDSVLVLQDAARPDARRHRIAAIDADLFAFEVLRAPDAGFGVVEDGAMMEGPHDEDRQRGEAPAVGAGGEIGRRRHLRHVEFEAPHHPAEGLDDGRHLFDVESDTRHPDRAILQCLGMAESLKDGLQRKFSHPWTS